MREARNPAARSLLRSIGMLFLGALLLMGVIGYFNYTPPPGPASVTAIANRQAPMLVLRLPPSSSGAIDDIIVYENDVSNAPAEVPRQVVRQPAAASGAGSTSVTQVQLGEAQWQRLDALRVTWCHAPPLFSRIESGEPVYDIAVRCGIPVRRVRLPREELPAALAALIEAVPPDQTGTIEE